MTSVLAHSLAVLACFGLAIMPQNSQQAPQSPAPATPPPPSVVRPQITAPDQDNPPTPSAQPASFVRMIDIPLLDCSGLPCIEMSTGSGKTLRLLIDTAEVNSYLDTKAAQALGVELQALKGGDNSSIDEVQQTVVPGAKLGELPMGDFPFLVLDTQRQPDKLGEKVEALPADGALTYSAFTNRLVAMDFAHRTLHISEPQASAQACPRACSELVVKHFGKYGPLTLTAGGFSINGQAVEAQIDTLFTGTMLIYPMSVEKLGLKKEAKAKHKEFFPFVQGGAKLARFDGVTEGFGDAPLMENAPVYFTTADDPPPPVQFDATVGTGLLSRATVTFDFKGMHMWMDGGAETATPRE